MYWVRENKALPKFDQYAFQAFNILCLPNLLPFDIANIMSIKIITEELFA